jgi:hypothetical protein
LASLILLITGEQLEVDGSVEEAARALENASRSSVGTLAWFTETTSDRTLGVNPLQVVTVRATDDE